MKGGLRNLKCPGTLWPDAVAVAQSSLYKNKQLAQGNKTKLAVENNTVIYFLIHP